MRSGNETRFLTGGTVIPVSLIAVVPTVLEKSVFYGYLAAASVSLGLPTQVCALLFINIQSFHACQSDSDNKEQPLGEVKWAWHRKHVHVGGALQLLGHVGGAQYNQQRRAQAWKRG